MTLSLSAFVSFGNLMDSSEGDTVDSVIDVDALEDVNAEAEDRREALGAV